MPSSEKSHNCFLRLALGFWSIWNSTVAHGLLIPRGLMSPCMQAHPEKAALCQSRNDAEQAAAQPGVYRAFVEDGSKVERRGQTSVRAHTPDQRFLLCCHTARLNGHGWLFFEPLLCEPLLCASCLPNTLVCQSG